jgi:integrase
MTPRKRASRIYWRNRNGCRRAYADFRDYGDVGGKREPLIPEGARFATEDPDVAARLVVARLSALEAGRRRRGLTGRAEVATLAAVAARYLVAKKRAGAVTDAWLTACQGFLERAVAYLGSDRELESIRVSDVRSWSTELLTTKGKTGKVLGPETVRRHLFTLSAVFRYAQEEELIPPGFNPVSLVQKPQRPEHDASWLEVHDAALFLEAARTLPTVRTAAGDAIGAGLGYPLLATLLLAGFRLREALGLELDDVSLDRKTIAVRPNVWRRLKTRTSKRVVPLVPQLEEILRAYLFGPRLDRGGRLLFPAFLDGREQMLTDIRKLINRVGVRAGWSKGELTSRTFRHTWCAARLATLAGGAPISVYQVSREMGHSSEDLVRRIYGHIASAPHRSEHVEFRVEQHVERLGERLRGLGFVTRFDTRESRLLQNESPRAPVTDGEAEGSIEWARRDSNARPLAPEASALSS